MIARSFFATLCVLTLAHCASTPRMHALRLRPGDDLRVALESFTREHHLRAGAIVTCAGSLTRASIRFANQPASTMLDGPFEIVSLTGTLSPDGAHLHISVSDAAGRTTGGHLSEGSIVYTTAEIVIAELRDVRFAREIDPQTTYRELVIHPERNLRRTRPVE